METRSNNILVGTVVLIMSLALAAFFIWLANDSGGKRQEFDIFFKQSVDGLNKGSQVTYSGVPSGEVTQIALWPEDPQFVRVRIEVNEDTPAPCRASALPGWFRWRWTARSRARRRLPMLGPPAAP